ncbi:transcriptional regulator [Kitasatospora sp. NPDC001660]
MIPGQRQKSVDVASATAAAVPKKARRFVPCVQVLPRLLVSAAEQWVSTTHGRIALDPYSWMQAVHWVVASGCYAPAWSHGPREMGRTTVRVAQELAALSPCRPGVEYLARKLKTTDRTVQNHLRMLREAGLLAYIVKGTRVRGERARASEFALVIPVAFDTALGVRTVGESTGRRMVGIAEAGRAVMAVLGKRAARKVRAARVKASAKASVTAPQAAPAGASSRVPHAADGTSAALCRCTPMEGGCCFCSADGDTPLPSESKLASGGPNSTTSKKSGKTSRSPRKLNRVGRRFQLAFELVQQVPWLHHALVPRVAWVIQEVADAGWTANEVMAWLETTDQPLNGTRRPTGLLAYRLKGVTLLPGWDTAEQRARTVERWNDSPHAAHARHNRARSTWSTQDWHAPTSVSVARMVTAAVAPASPGPDADVLPDLQRGEDGLVLLEQLSREEIIDLRVAAQQDWSLVTMTIEEAGEDYARRLYTNVLVDRVLRIKGTGRMALNRHGRNR